jgi:hypothetical protein
MTAKNYSRQPLGIRQAERVLATVHVISYAFWHEVHVWLVTCCCPQSMVSVIQGREDVVSVQWSQLPSFIAFRMQPCQYYHTLLQSILCM